MVFDFLPKMLSFQEFVKGAFSKKCQLHHCPASYYSGLLAHHLIYFQYLQSNSLFLTIVDRTFYSGFHFHTTKLLIYGDAHAGVHVLSRHSSAKQNLPSSEVFIHDSLQFTLCFCNFFVANSTVLLLHIIIGENNDNISDNNDTHAWVTAGKK